MTDRPGRAPSAALRSRREQKDESRRRIIEAAQAEFVARGYRAATTRTIARRAEVSEVTLFRHFASKSDLFGAAILDPVTEIIAGHRARHLEPSVSPAALPRRIHSGIDHLVGVDSLDGDLIMALAREAGDDAADEELRPRLRATIETFLTTLEESYTVRTGDGGSPAGPTPGPRMVFAMLMAVQSHAAWLFPDDRRPSGEELVAELAALATWGLTGPPLDVSGH